MRATGIQLINGMFTRPLGTAAPERASGQKHTSRPQWRAPTDPFSSNATKRKGGDSDVNGDTTRNNKKEDKTMFTFYSKFIVRKHERALLFRDGDFVKFLEPGVYRRITLLHRYAVDW
jgi:hypothetical protein